VCVTFICVTYSNDASHTATRAVTDVVGVIFRWIATGRGWPSPFRPLRTSISYKSNSRNSYKNRIPRIGDLSEMAPSAMSHHVGKWSKTTRPTSPDSSVWPIRHADGLLDGFWLSEAGSADFDRIPPWRQQTGSGVPERAGVICRLHDQGRPIRFRSRGRMITFLCVNITVRLFSGST